MSLVSQFFRSESGATAIEYGLIAGFIACVIIAALQGVGTRANNKFRAVSNALS